MINQLIKCLITRLMTYMINLLIECFTNLFCMINWWIIWLVNQYWRILRRDYFTNFNFKFMINHWLKIWFFFLLKTVPFGFYFLDYHICKAICAKLSTVKYLYSFKYLLLLLISEVNTVLSFNLTFVQSDSFWHSCQVLK